MPTKAPRSCAFPGCPELVYSGRYCIKHSRAVERQRGSSASRGYDARWRVIRARFLFDHPWCCDPFGVHGNVKVEATDVDHIIRRRDGGPDTEDNLQPLCHSCHSRKTMSEMGRGGQIPAASKSKTAPYPSFHTREMDEGGSKSGGGQNGG